LLLLLLLLLLLIGFVAVDVIDKLFIFNAAVVVVEHVELEQVDEDEEDEEELAEEPVDDTGTEVVVVKFEFMLAIVLLLLDELDRAYELIEDLVWLVLNEPVEQLEAYEL
jgi:hypothetical protein